MRPAVHMLTELDAIGHNPIRQIRVRTPAHVLQDSALSAILDADDTVADCYLFVMLLWAKKFDVEAPATLVAFCERMMKLPSVQKAMKHEGLS